MRGKITTIQVALHNYAQIQYRVMDGEILLDKTATVIITKEEATQYNLDDVITVTLAKE
jgi:hypothetical protein